MSFKPIRTTHEIETIVCSFERTLAIHFVLVSIFNRAGHLCVRLVACVQLLTSPSPDFPGFGFWTSIPTKNFIVYQHGNRRGKKAISHIKNFFKSECVSGDSKQVAFCQKCSSHRVLNISKVIFSASLCIS